jgi:hypothetical protein
MPAFDLNAEITGLKEVLDAFARNPKTVERETKNFFSRAIATYKKGIWNNPWRIGMSGGGVPVDTGNLRDTHRTELRRWEAVIYPTADYKKAVHSTRPWLDYVMATKEKEVMQLADNLLKEITKDLAK